MDPRYPEQAISRMRELMKQYDRVEADMNKATTSSQLAQLEREGGLVVQEICLVAPRIHEAMMQASRQRRHDLSRGILIEPQDIAVETPQGGMFEPEIVEKPVEKSVEAAAAAKEYLEKSVMNSEIKLNMTDAEKKELKEKIEKEVPEIKEVVSKKKTTRKKKTTKKTKK